MKTSLPVMLCLTLNSCPGTSVQMCNSWCNTLVCANTECTWPQYFSILPPMTINMDRREHFTIRKCKENNDGMLQQNSGVGMWYTCHPWMLKSRCSIWTIDQSVATGFPMMRKYSSSECEVTEGHRNSSSCILHIWNYELHIWSQTITCMYSTHRKSPFYYGIFTYKSVTKKVISCGGIAEIMASFLFI